MAKPWERPWSTDEIIANSENWSLAGDVALLNTLKSFADTVLQRVDHLNDNVTGLTSNLDQAALQLEISQNRFRSLRNTQFIESRVYDDDETLPDIEPVKVPEESPEKEDHSDQIKRAVDRGLAVIDKYFDKVEVAVSDSEDDNDFPSFVLRPKDPYIDRPLPYVIGTEEWHKSWHVGLEDSSSDSGTEKNSDDEKFSETDSESDLPVLDRSQIKGISDTTSGSSESDFVADRNKPVIFGKNRPEADEKQEQQVFQDPAGSLSSRDDFARTLAAKLGDVITNHSQANKSGDTNRFPEDEVVNTRPLQKDKAPASKFTDNLFFDEPPPLVDEGGAGGKFSGGHGLFDDEDDEEDDWGKTDPAAQKSTLLDKGGLFDDDVTDEDDSIFTPKKSILYPPSNVLSKPPLFYDEPPALDDTAEIANPKLKKTEKSDKEKKPQETAKKLSLFDSDDDTEVGMNDKKIEGLFDDEAIREGKPKTKKPTGGVSMLGGGLFDKKLLLRRPTSSTDEEDNAEGEGNAKQNAPEEQDKPTVAKNTTNVLKHQSSSEDDDSKIIEEKQQQGATKQIKKPIGGVSILGGASFLDKKLLLRRRPSSSEDEAKETETKTEPKAKERTKQIEKQSENNSRRLFSSDEDDEKTKKNTGKAAEEKGEKPTVAKRKNVISEEKAKATEEKKKASLFDDEVDTAITVKKAPEKKKFNLFDDDDLFKDDLFSSKPATITKSLTSSLFDDDEIPEVDDKKSKEISKPAAVLETAVQKESKSKNLFGPPETDDLFSSKPAEKTTFGAPPPPSEEPPEDTFVDTEPDTRMSSGLFDSPPPDTDFDDLFGAPPSTSDVFPTFGDVSGTTEDDLFGGETYDDLFIPKIQSRPRDSNVKEKNTNTVVTKAGIDGVSHRAKDDLFGETKVDLFGETRSDLLSETISDDLFIPKSQSTPEAQEEQILVHKAPRDVGPKTDVVTKADDINANQSVTGTKSGDDASRNEPEERDVTRTNDDDIIEVVVETNDDHSPERTAEVPVPEPSDDVVSETPTIRTSEASKGEETPRKASPGKLKHNLAINVGALMPGSAPPRSNLVKKSISSEPLRDVDFVEPDVEVLHSVTKDRAKVPFRRQPSTRRGRQAALRASGSDFKLNSQDNGDSIEVIEKPEVPVKVEAEQEKNVEKSSETTQEDKKKIDDGDGQKRKETSAKKPPVGGVSILGASLDLDRKLLLRRQASEEKVTEDKGKTKPSLFDSDDDGNKNQDLFGNKPEKGADIEIKTGQKKLFSDDDDEDDDDKKQDRNKTKKLDKGISIIGALDQKRTHSIEKETDKKQESKSKKQISLFDSDEEDKSLDKESDLFSSSSRSSNKTKSFQKSASALPKKSEGSKKKPVKTDLFGDDEDDDDLFGGSAKASSKAAAGKLKNASTKVTSVTKAPVKHSLFSDDDEDDIFQSSSSAAVKRPETKQAVERKIPVRSTKKLETPTDDPLSDLLR